MSSFHPASHSRVEPGVIWWFGCHQQLCWSWKCVVMNLCIPVISNFEAVVSCLWISETLGYTFRSDTSDSDKMGCVISQIVAYWFACVQTPGIFFCIFLIDLYFSTIVHQHFPSLWQIEKEGSVSPDMAFHFEYFFQIPSNFVFF